jgi:hypothetical protein
MYTFVPDGNIAAPSDLQLYCHFEIHLNNSCCRCSSSCSTTASVNRDRSDDTDDNNNDNDDGDNSDDDDNADVHRVALSLEEFINSRIIGPGTGSGFRAEVYFHKRILLPKNSGAAIGTATATATDIRITSYMIALFGDREPITKAKAETVRLTIREELGRGFCNNWNNCSECNDPFQLMDRGSWTTSNPRPVSLLPGQMKDDGSK